MAERGPRHRFELTRLEIGGVVVSAAATLFVVFLLGVYAGRGMSAHEGGADQLVRVPVAAATEGEDAGDKWTFDETAPARDTASAASHGAANAAQHASAPPAPASDVQAAKRDAAAVAPKAAAEPPAKAADIGPDDDAEASGDATAHSARAVAKADTKPARPAVVETDPTPSPKARVAVAVAGPTPAPQGAMRGDWSVQVTATKDPKTADAMASRLKARGYQAYVQRVQRREGTLYRVRVGRYPTLETANQIVARLRREPGVPEAFVASD